MRPVAKAPAQSFCVGSPMPGIVACRSSSRCRRAPFPASKAGGSWPIRIRAVPVVSGSFKYFVDPVSIRFQLIGVANRQGDGLLKGSRTVACFESA